METKELIESLREISNMRSISTYKRTICKMAAQRLTQLTAELEQLRDNMEMFHSYRHVCAGLPPDHLRDLIQAEKEGRLWVPPCMKGDVLWSYYTWPIKSTYSFNVLDVSILNGKTMLNTDKCGVISAESVGKTVFLTREEAEAALKGGPDHA